jgi:hypothetical protein
MTDWSAWSRDAVALMQRRNQEWQDRFSLAKAPFHWDLDSATIRFRRKHDQVIASLCLVGTTSEAEGTFLWAWANETIPPAARHGLEAVRRFGEVNQLPLLATPEVKGSRSEALELLAVAGRIMDAEGAFVDPTGDVTCFFALSHFRIEP